VVETFIHLSASTSGSRPDARQDCRCSKANLCGADLRGALIDGVDFYLVDLRGARFDPEQELHFRRCRAILEARTDESA
jgi:uncharacterized protein YjbI with pentapeptide repeats